jgi:hypothetical protein
MKKLLLITLICILAVAAFGVGTPRVYTQKLWTSTGENLPGVTNGASTSAPGYIVTAWITARPGEVMSTDATIDNIAAVPANPTPATSIRINRFGNGSTMPYETVAVVQLGTFPTPWAIGEICHVVVTYVASGLFVEWDMTIPTGSVAITYKLPGDPVPPIVFDPVIPANPPVPAVYDTPLNGTPDLGYAGQLLTWHNGVGGGAPTGYKVYFGMDNPPLTMVSDQVGTNYATGALAQVTTYYWKVVPYNVDGEAPEPNLVWSFITRAENNPNPAINPTPSDGDHIAMSSPTLPFDLTLSWQAGPGLPPSGYRISWNGGPEVEAIGTSHVVSILATGDYTWYVIPYIVDGGMRKDLKPVEVTFGSNRTNSVRGDAVGWVPWTFTVDPYVPGNYTVDITSAPTGAEVFLGAMSVGFTPYSAIYPEGFAGTFTVQIPGYTWAPANLVITNLAGPVVQHFVGTPITYQFIVTSVPTNAAILVNGMPSGFNTPWPFTMGWNSNATYSVQMPGYTWAPIDYTVNNILADGSVNFNGTMLTYNVMVTSTPPGARIWVDGIESPFFTPWPFIMNWNTNATYSVQMPGWTFAPLSVPVNNIMADTPVDFFGSMITYPVTITSTPSGAEVLVGGIPSGLFTPQVFNQPWNTSATYSVQMLDVVFTPVDFVVNNIIAPAAQLFTGYSTATPLVFMIPEWMQAPNGMPALIYYNDNYPPDIDYTIYNYTDMITQGYQAVNPLATDANTWGVVLNQTAGIVNLQIGGIPANTVMYIAAKVGGVWVQASPYPYFDTVPGYVTIALDFGVVRGPVGVLQSVLPITTPVTLSGFDAAVTASNFVSLTWVTESETEAMGFNIYRSENANVSDSYKINNSIIPATNTSQQHTYNVVDSENLIVGNTYYYWLESVDLTGYSVMNGPVNVTLTGGTTPPLPELSVMGNAYPNPFRVGDNTTISVDIKEGENGTVTVYNLLGQVVKTYRVTEGQHNLTWNAKGCASGIYFYKLSTPTVNSTKKLVIVN